MLKLFRNKNVTKMILWAILILIMPAFVIWGAGSMSRSASKGPRYVGLIDKKKVTFDAFAGSVIATRCQVVLAYFDRQETMEFLLKNEPIIGKMAWDRLIMLAEAKKGKFRASDAEVVDFIKTHPIFIRNGRFDERVYNIVLKNSLGMSNRGFEETVRENLALKKLNDFIVRDAKVTDEEIAWAYARKNDKFSIAYVLLPESVIPAEVEKAREELGSKTAGTPFFGLEDYVEGLGEARPLVEAASRMKKGDISEIVLTRKGLVIFKLLEVQAADRNKLTEERETYAAAALLAKKDILLEDWLKGLEKKSVLNIDLEKFEQYYQ